jgi:hypothetical protein
MDDLEACTVAAANEVRMATNDIRTVVTHVRAVSDVLARQEWS